MLIIAYPHEIALPVNAQNISGKDYARIRYSAFSTFNVEDQASGVNWYFSYKREMKKLVIFKEHVNGIIKKYEIPTARHGKNGTVGFIEELEKIGIKIKKED